MFIVNLVNAVIGKPLGWVLRLFAGLFGGNFAVAVFLFTVLINVILIPLSIKSQKSSVQQTRIKPKLDELRKRYGDDRQKMAQAQQELYQEEGVSMSGGCLPMILRLVLMMSIYGIILSPMTYLMSCPKATVEKAAETYNVKTAGYYELNLIKEIGKDPSKAPELEKKIEKVDFDLFGIDLTKTPSVSKMFNEPGDLIWVIPIGAFIAQLLTGLISARINKKVNPDAPSMMGMMLFMPLFSLFIGFTLTGGVGFYWICSSIVGGAIQSAIQLWYGPYKMLSKERAKELATRCDFETKQLEKFAEVTPDE